MGRQNYPYLNGCNNHINKENPSKFGLGYDKECVWVYVKYQGARSRNHGDFDWIQFLNKHVPHNNDYFRHGQEKYPFFLEIQNISLTKCLSD